MAIEEITLSVPVTGRADVDTSDKGSSDRDAASSFVRSYRKLVRERDRFAIGRRVKERRQENFEVAFKSLVKHLAQEATGGIADRTARLAARTRIYISIVGLAYTLSEDQRRAVRAARRAMKWAVAIGAIGVIAMAYTMVSGSWLP
ncbi:MAG: hypothetical protein P8Y69_05425 [Gammaproteobacteria bacterium]|jgi:hypothetical protein